MNIVAQSKHLLLDLGASPILYLMIGLSVISVAVMLERGWFYFTIRENLERLAQALSLRLDGGDLVGATRLVERSTSAEAAIVRAGLLQYERGADAVSEAMASAAAVQRMRLERRLAFLGTLGNNAPFVGLLGTVIGIVQAFDRLEHAGVSQAVGNAQSSEVMGAIAEALVATAIGLAVAIPAVAAFNYFQRRIKQILGNSEALSHLLLSQIKARPLPGAIESVPPTPRTHGQPENGLGLGARFDRISSVPSSANA